MLRVDLATSRYMCDHEDDLEVRLTNVSGGVCAKIFLRLALPSELLQVGGSDTFELGRLPPGGTSSHTLRIRPRQPGHWAITSPNFSYRDALGQAYRVEGLRLVVDVAPPALITPIERSPSARPAMAPAEAMFLRQKLQDSQHKLAQSNRRLLLLEKQKIYYGISVNPGVIMEIDDLQAEVARLEKEITQLRARLGE